MKPLRPPNPPLQLRQRQVREGAIWVVGRPDAGWCLRINGRCSTCLGASGLQVRRTRSPTAMNRTRRLWFHRTSSLLCSSQVPRLSNAPGP